jgi:hypothetical protein
LKAWRQNEMSLKDAVAALFEIEFSAEQAWRLLERT